MPASWFYTSSNKVKVGPAMYVDPTVQVVVEVTQCNSLVFVCLVRFLYYSTFIIHEWRVLFCVLCLQNKTRLPIFISFFSRSVVNCFVACLRMVFREWSALTIRARFWCLLVKFHGRSTGQDGPRLGEMWHSADGQSGLFVRSERWTLFSLIYFCIFQFFLLNILSCFSFIFFMLSCSN